MRKISSYLYSNRIELLADLAGFNVEYTNVYQRTVKIYKGVDNVLEFDIKNADQKRLDIAINPTITNIRLNVMDSEGNKLPNSPYTVSPYATVYAGVEGATVVATSGKSTTTTITFTTSDASGTFVPGALLTGDSGSLPVVGIVGPVTITKVVSDIDSGITTLTVTFGSQTVSANTTNLSSTSEPIKGIGTVTIPSTDLTNIEHQFLRYSVTATKGSATIPLYVDSRFGAVGTIEVAGTAMPSSRKSQVITEFHADLTYSNMINEYLHSTAIPIRFYEAIPTTTAKIDFIFNQLQGTVYVEATSDATISNESFPASGNPTLNPDGTRAAVRRGTVIDSFTVGTSDLSASKVYSNLGQYVYLRVSYIRSSQSVNGTWQPGYGAISQLTVTSPAP